MPDFIANWLRRLRLPLETQAPTSLKPAELREVPPASRCDSTDPLQRLWSSLDVGDATDRAGVNNVLDTSVAARRCGICGQRGHNATTCCCSVRCGLCDGVGHNRRTCPNTIRCGRCGQRGHNSRTCADDANDRDLEIALPRGPRLTDLDRHPEWHGAEVFDDATTLEQAINRLERREYFKPAMRLLAAAVHRASNRHVYVGRCGGSARHLISRFFSHWRNHDARWITPVVRVSTRELRRQQWEAKAIRWAKLREHRGELCCNNDVVDQRGQWPSTPDSLIYVVACRTRRS